MNIAFRDTFEIIQKGKDSSGNDIILFQDSSGLSDQELTKLGIDDKSPIFGVKTIFSDHVMPVPPENKNTAQPEVVSGVEITSSGVPKKAAQNVFDALTV